MGCSGGISQHPVDYFPRIPLTYWAYGKARLIPNCFYLRPPKCTPPELVFEEFVLLCCGVYVVPLLLTPPNERPEVEGVEPPCERVELNGVTLGCVLRKDEPPVFPPNERPNVEGCEPCERLGLNLLLGTSAEPLASEPLK